MGELGIYASKLSINIKSLKEFDEALRFIKGKNEVTRTGEAAKVIDKLLNVINPISEAIKGNLSESTSITEHSIINILKNRHEREWPVYKQRILELSSKMNSTKFQLGENDFQLLNDIADGLDAECANLFHRMSER